MAYKKATVPTSSTLQAASVSILLAPLVNQVSEQWDSGLWENPGCAPQLLLNVLWGDFGRGLTFPRMKTKQEPGLTEPPSSGVISLKIAGSNHLLVRLPPTPLSFLFVITEPEGRPCPDKENRSGGQPRLPPAPAADACGRLCLLRLLSLA